ncbi:MAG: DUF6161 domain-containing protein [Gammaproteobacteria bacterium]|nr:DUF6161 domain-containing protein [Gammaproteobacteria bacterium]
MVDFSKINNPSAYGLTDVYGKKLEIPDAPTLVQILKEEADFWKKRQESSDISSQQLHHYICHEILSKTASSIQNTIYRSDETIVHKEVEKSLKLLSEKWLWSGHPHLEEFVRCNKLYDKEVAIDFLNTVFTESEYQYAPKSNRSYRGLSQGQTRALAYLMKKESEKQYQDFVGRYETRIIELEKTYEEKLRLEKPAEHWKKAGDRFKNQAKGWSILLGGILLFGVVLFSVFFSDWVKGQELPVDIDTVQGMVIFSTLLAVYAFLVRVLSRLTFSAFHLMRDAEEREQLTYVYLSLTKEKVLDEASRNLILQALFSRSQTGLLSKGSGPSMPGIGEIRDFLDRK